MISKLFYALFLFVALFCSRQEASAELFGLVEPREPVYVQTRAYLSRSRGKGQEFRFPLVSENALNRMMQWRSFQPNNVME
ncbi:hypothetical protein L596_016162 [Steinernema carpocapsae]|uniref:Peptidase M12A domain-containing protein n=1 Tax=Steinernema carpocapsae TaxID=34508 RepID=A0A4U5NH61_STECR|nr:hypothetical protein L596_016162 [Steinernema carpocapsae]